MGSRKNLIIGILAVLFLAAVFLFSQFNKLRVGAPELDSPRAKQVVRLPESSQTFQVVSADGTWPKFVEATIDPLDVKPGQIQKMRVVLNDDVEITEVVAEIETDKGVNKVPLRRVSQSAVSKADLLQKKYFIKDGRLILLDGKNNKEFVLAKFVEAASLQKFTYEGQWLVQDTHEKTYQTVFVAKDVSGRSEQLVMAWTDPCTAPSSGEWVIGSSQICGTGVTEGAEGGNVSFSSATCGGLNPKCTLIVLSGATLSWNPGYTVSLFGGGVPTGILVLESGASLKQGYLCVVDADADGYYPTPPPPPCYRVDESTCTGIGPGCTINTLPAYFAGTCTAVSAGCPSNPNDPLDVACYNSPNSRTCTSVASSFCGPPPPPPPGTPSVGTASNCSDLGVSYKRRSTLGPADCNDNNFNVKPGQTAYFTVATTTNSPTTGAVNFDYNCDGVGTKQFQTYCSDFLCQGVLNCQAGGCNPNPAAPGYPGCPTANLTNTPACGSDYLDSSGCGYPFPPACDQPCQNLTIDAVTNCR